MAIDRTGQDKLLKIVWDRWVKKESRLDDKPLVLTLGFGEELELTAFGDNIFIAKDGPHNVEVGRDILEMYKQETGKDIQIFEDEFVRELYLLVTWMRERLPPETAEKI